MQRSPSGEQWTISRGDQHATVVQVGGGLRTYSAGGRDVLAGYDVEEKARSGRGQLLVPWPNRIRDGRYSWQGATRQLDLTEPARHNASHGLLRWALWELEHHGDDELTVLALLHPQPGWDWHLDVRARYRLTDDGLVVEVSARNTGRGTAPFGFGAHPYLAIGDVPLPEVTLDLPADTRMDVEPDRMLPTGTQPVDGGPDDFRGGRPIGDTVLDTAFTDLHRDADGRWEVRLGNLAGGRSVALWGGPGLTWAQVFTRKGVPAGPGEAPYELGVAVEPMTCPPDAFNSGTGVVALDPGATWSAEWGVRPQG